MELTTYGQIEDIFDMQVISATYKKRELVLRVDEEYNGKTYPQYLKFSFPQTKADFVEKYAIGQWVTISANIRGNRWEKEGKVFYFTELQGWLIKADSQGAPQQSAPPHSYTDEYQQKQQKPNHGGGVNWGGGTPSGDNADDLPF